VSKKNLIRKIIESAGGGSSSGWKSTAERQKEEQDFNKVRKVISSVETRDQLKTAIKVINNFIEKYGVINSSPEYKLLAKLVNIKKIKFGIGRSKKHRGSEDEDLSERIMIRKIIREEIEDFDWIKDVSAKEEGKMDVGDVYMINPEKDQKDSNRSMIFKIIDSYIIDISTGKSVYYTYEILESNSTDEPKGHKEVIGESWAQELINDNYWVFLYNEKDKKTKEEPLEEDSYWGSDEFWGTENSGWKSNDPNWGTENSMWGKDSKWGEGGGTTGGDSGESED
jgi:hypothetical protein